MNNVMATESEMKSEDIDTNFLPLIYDVIRNVERDSQDSNQKMKESQDNNQRLQNLKAMFNACRDQIKQLPGIEFSEKEQLKYFDNLRQQLVLKQELLLKYRNMCHFSDQRV